MAQRFNLTAQLQLQAPTNTQQVINQIRNQLQGVNVNVNVQANTRAVNQVNQSLQNTTRQANSAARSVGVLNKNLSEAARRFGVITLATGTMLSFAQAVKRAVGEAIEFERELVRIAQTTGQTVSQLSSLTQEVTRLSTGLGVSSSSLLQTARILAQAGFAADDTRKALDILAKTTLGASFDDITQTVEGAIAVLRQFRAEAIAAGGEIKFLEQTLDAINSVSKAFAVESSDLIAVIQRVGGVFASAGGSVNELIALFTSVRATTRESAETIATGLRTIFTRIQRTDTVNKLEQLGISLRDAEGRFVGAFEAVRRLSTGLAALDPRDYRFSEIVEELGGFRQIGKVIPLIQQFAVAQDALNVAQGASGSVAEDALTAQQALAVQAQKVREEFAALIRQLADSSTFRSIASAALSLAKALISIGSALEPVLPLLTSLLALKIGQGLAPGLGAILGFGGRRRYGGGVIRKFARGGFVPGTGNSDSVPAMLQPGEFVIRKSSAQKLGAETLTAMNENRYNKGTTGKGAQPIQKGKQASGVGIFDSDKILGGTSAKKALLEQIRASKKPYQVIAGPAGSGKTTFASSKFGGNFVLTPSDLQKYSRFVVLSGAGKTKSGDFSDDVKGLLSGASGITVLNPDTERLMQQRQGRVDAAMSGNLPDQRSVGALQGTMKAPTDSNLDLFRGYGNVNVLDRYAAGGIVTNDRHGYGVFSSNSKPMVAAKNRMSATAWKNTPDDEKQRLAALEDKNLSKKALAAQKAKDKKKGIAGQITLRNVGGFFLSPNKGTDRDFPLKGKTAILNKERYKLDGKIEGFYTGKNDISGGKIGSIVRSETKKGLQNSIISASNTILSKKLVDIPPIDGNEKVFENSMSNLFKKGGAQATIEGYMLEGIISALSGASLAGGKASFDYPESSLSQAKSRLGPIFRGEGDLQSLIKADAKRTATPKAIQSIVKKSMNDIKSGLQDGSFTIQKFATGGAVGTDTVPALLTPGEFVINKESAQSIGYTNLNNMNKTGVARFAKGGPVGFQMFQTGGKSTTISGNQLNDVINGGSITVQLECCDDDKKKSDDKDDAQKDQKDNLDKSNTALGAFTSKMDKVAGSLQSFVFLGSLAASLGSQFSGLNEETKAAISETAGFVTAVAGTAGTILQMVSSVLSSTASNTANSVSTATNTAATNANSAAQSRAAATGSGLAVGIGLAVVAITAVAAAFKFYAAKARAEADSLKEAADNQLKAIQDGTGSIEDFTNSITKSSSKQQEAAAFDAGSTGAIKAGIGGAAIGAAVGSVVPVIGTALGALIGGAAGAILGGIYSYTNELNRQADIAARFGAELEKSANNLAVLSQAQSSFKQALNDIDIEENLAPEERVTRRLSAQADVAPINQAAIADANRQLQLLAKEVGKPVSELTKADFEKDPTLANTFDLATKSLATATQGLAQDVSESRKTLSEAAKIELTGDKSLDEVIASGGQVAQALQASRQALIADAQARKQALQSQLNGNISAEKRTQIEKQIVDNDQRLNQQLKDQYDGLNALNEETRKAKIALQESNAAQEAYRQSLFIISAFNNALTAAEQGLNKLDKSLGNLDALLSGGNFDFTRDAPAGLDNLLEVGDRNIFEKEVDRIGQSLGPAGQKLANKIKDTSSFLEKAQTELIGKTFTTEDVINTEEILKNLGLDTKLLTKEQLGIIDKELKEAAQDGITEEEFQKIFAPIIKQGESAADLFKRANSFLNQEYQLRQKWVDSLQKQFNAELEARQAFVDTSLKASELSAKARGEELTPAQKERARLDRAQVGLTGLDGRPIAQAGDVAGVAAARSMAQAQLVDIAQKIEAGVQDPSLVNAQKYYTDAVEKTTKELDRLSNQTDKAADIMGEIEKERAKREALQGVTESFVVGGEKDRQQINQALAGIQQAVATGTLQNQTEEQRRATVQMLDTLKDIQIPGAGGLTGGQVKEQLIMQDAMRLGLDPQVAKAIYGRTSKEEQLINSMDMLGAQMMNAAQANVTFEAQKTQMIINSEQQLIQAINMLTQTIMGAAPGVNPVGLAKGGNVPQYRSIGGDIFRKKGTDTVPAMLTPGEFVVNRQASQKNRSLLEMINNGQSAIGYSDGGSVKELEEAKIIAKNQSERVIQATLDLQLASKEEQEASRGKDAKALKLRAEARKKAQANLDAAIKAHDEAKARVSSLSYQQFPYQRKPQRAYEEYTQGDGSDFLSAIEQDPSFGVIPTPANALPVSPPQMPAAPRQAGTEQERKGKFARQKGLESQRKRREEARARMVSYQSQYGQSPYMGQQNMQSQQMSYTNQQMMQPQMGGGYSYGSGMMNNNRGMQLNPMQNNQQNYSGGSFGMDVGSIQKVFDNAIVGFSGIFDNIVKSFSGIQNALTQFSVVMSNITMQHTVTVEGLISVGGLNLESIKQELSTSIGRMVSQEVERVIDEKNKGFKAG